MLGVHQRSIDREMQCLDTASNLRNSTKAELLAALESSIILKVSISLADQVTVTLPVFNSCFREKWAF